MVQNQSSMHFQILVCTGMGVLNTGFTEWFSKPGEYCVINVLRNYKNVGIEHTDFMFKYYPGEINIRVNIVGVSDKRNTWHQSRSLVVTFSG